MLHVPVPAPAMALRTLRKAAWSASSLEQVADARAALTSPMGDLAVAWVRFCETFDAYMTLRSAERWSDLHDALVHFDVCAAVFFGPSGAERQTRDRPQVDAVAARSPEGGPGGC